MSALKRQLGGLQRSAGTRTVPDVLKAWFGRGRRPEMDRALIDAGGEIGMICWRYAEGRPISQEVLVLGTSERATGSLAGALGRPPYDILSEEVSTSIAGGSPLLFDVEGNGRDGRWKIAIPLADLGTFRSVLAAVNARGQ